MLRCLVRDGYLSKVRSRAASDGASVLMLTVRQFEAASTLTSMLQTTQSLSPTQPEEPSVGIAHVAESRFDHNGVVLAEAYLYRSERWPSTSDMSLRGAPKEMPIVEAAMAVDISSASIAIKKDQSGHVDSHTAYVRASTAPPGLDGCPSGNSHGVDRQTAEDSADDAITPAPSPRNVALARRRSTGCNEGGAAYVIQIASVLPELSILAEEAPVDPRGSTLCPEESDCSLPLHIYELEAVNKVKSRAGCATSSLKEMLELEGDCCFLPLHSHEVDLGDKAETSEKSEGSDTFARKEATEIFGDSLVFVGKGPATSRGAPTIHDGKPGVASMTTGQQQDRATAGAATLPAPDLFNWFPGLSKPSQASAPPPPPTPPPPPELRTPRGHGLARLLVPPIHLSTGTKRCRLSARKLPQKARLTVGLGGKPVKQVVANDKERTGGTRVISRMRQLMGSKVKSPGPRSR